MNLKNTFARCAVLWKWVVLRLPCFITLVLLFSVITKNLWSQNSDRATTDWPIFRGNTSLNGVAAGDLSDKLSLLWTFKAGDDIKSSPVVAQQTVFIGADDGQVYALDLTAGQKRWSFKTGHAFEAAPLVLDQTVFIGALNGTLYALDAGTGSVKWTSQAGSKIIGSANWVRLQNQTGILVGSYDFKMYCVNALTGKPLWIYSTENFINGCPATDGQRIIFGGCDANLHVVSAQTGKKLAAIDVGSYIAGSGTIAGNQAFIGHYGNQFICVDLVSHKIRWSFEDSKNGAPFFSSPAIGQGRVVVGSRDKFVYCLNQKSGELIWKFQTLDEVDSSPVICGKKVVVGSADGRLYILNFDTGSQIWSYEIGAAILSSPAVVAGRIVAAAEDGRILCFGVK